MKVSVTFSDDSSPVQSVAVGEEVRVGRAESNDISINDPLVSSEHCLIRVEEESVFVTDLGSTNGTFLNGETVRQAEIKDGDVIQVGDTQLVVHATQRRSWGRGGEGGHQVVEVDNPEQSQVERRRLKRLFQQMLHRVAAGTLTNGRFCWGASAFVIYLAVLFLWYDSENPLWRGYMWRPDNHPNIPNCSYAGYRYGEKDFPVPDIAANVKTFGAKGDGANDDTAAFKQAIHAAEENGGGTVFIPEGTYRVTGMLRLPTSGIVLRGAGPAKTVLCFEKSLSDIRDAKSEWSWRGGLVWVEPNEVEEEVVSDDGFPTVWIRKPAKQGAKVVELETSFISEYANAAGKLARMRWKGGTDLAEQIIGGRFAEPQSWTNWQWMTDGILRWEWCNEITQVDGNRLTLKKPLRLDIRPGWEVSIGPLTAYTKEVGVEHLTLRMPIHERPGHLRDPGFNGIYLRRTIHGWIRNIRIENADNGLILEDASHITITSMTFAGESCHHATSFRFNSHDNVVQNFRVEARPMHGMSAQDLASGNVWRKGTMLHGTFDYHRGMPFDSIRTDIVLCNDGRLGGSRNGGPLAGRRMVHWNVEVLTNRVGKVSSRCVYEPGLFRMSALVGIRGAEAFYKTSVVDQVEMPLAGDRDNGTVVCAHNRVPKPADLLEAQRQLRFEKSEVGRTPQQR